MLDGTKLRNNTSNAGTYVWGCRLNKSDFLYSVTKTLEPTKMLIRSNKQNTSAKRFWAGHENHAVCISKTDRILKSKVYALTWEGLDCFSTKKECTDYFKKTALALIREIENDRQAKIDFFNKYIGKLSKYEDYDFE